MCQLAHYSVELLARIKQELGCELRVERDANAELILAVANGRAWAVERTSVPAVTSGERRTNMNVRPDNWAG